MRLSKNSLFELLNEQDKKGPSRDVDVDPYPFEPDEVNPDELFSGDSEWENASEEDKQKIIANRQKEAIERHNKAKADWDRREQEQASAGPSAQDVRRTNLQKDIGGMERAAQAVSIEDPRQRQIAIDAERARRREESGESPRTPPRVRTDPKTGEKFEFFTDQGGVLRRRPIRDPEEEKRKAEAYAASPEGQRKAQELKRIEDEQATTNKAIADIIDKLKQDKKFAAKWGTSGFDETNLRGYFRSKGGIPTSGSVDVDIADITRSLEAGEASRKATKDKDIKAAKTWGVNLSDDQLDSLTPAELRALTDKAKRDAVRGARTGGSVPQTSASSATSSSSSSAPAAPAAAPSTPASGKGTTGKSGTPTAAITPTATRTSTSYMYGNVPSVAPTGVMASAQQPQGTLNYATYERTTGSPQTVIAAASGKGVPGLPSIEPSISRSASSSGYDSGQLKFGSTTLAKNERPVKGAKRAIAVKGPGGYQSEITNVAPALAESTKFQKNELLVLLEQISTPAKESVRSAGDSDFGDSTLAKIATAPFAPILLPPGMRLPTSLVDIGWTQSNLKRGLKYYNNPALAGMFLAGIGKQLQKGAVKGFGAIQGTKVGKQLQNLINKASSAGNLTRQFADKLSKVPVLGDYISAMKTAVGDEQTREKLAREMYAHLVDVRARGVEIPPPKEKPEPTEVLVKYGATP